MANFSPGGQDPPRAHRSYATEGTVSKRDCLTAKQRTGVTGGEGDGAAGARVRVSVGLAGAGARRSLQLILRGDGGGGLDDPIILWARRGKDVNRLSVLGHM